jgi:hypothetical protein
MMDRPVLEPDSAAPPPRIVIRSRDDERLRGVAINGLLTSPRKPGVLLDELRRAVVQPDDVVGDDRPSPDPKARPRDDASPSPSNVAPFRRPPPARPPPDDPDPPRAA